MAGNIHKSFFEKAPTLTELVDSVRGTEVCIDLASRLGLHVFDCVNVGSSFLAAIL